jgi:hypothetical protein
MAGQKVVHIYLVEDLEPITVPLGQGAKTLMSRESLRATQKDRSVTL